jgi:hypothetical protein
MGREDRGGIAAGLTSLAGLAALLLPACGGPALVEGGAGAAGESGVQPVAFDVTIPPDVVAPLLSCGDAVGSIAIQLPCELGQAPVSEVDCTLGGAAAGQKLAFMLAPSLAAGDFGKSVVLGAPTAFHATPLPGGSPVVNGRYSISAMLGTVTFAELSFSDQTFDGWFRHLTVMLTGNDGSIVSCSLDKGRFTAVPGNYL